MVSEFVLLVSGAALDRVNTKGAPLVPNFGNRVYKLCRRKEIIREMEGVVNVATLPAV